MFCENCGNEIDESMFYCAVCGFPLKAETKQEAVRRNKTKKPLWFYIILLVALLVLLVVVPAYFVFFSKGAMERREMERQLELAERYLDKLNYDKAVAAYRAVLEIDPENKEALEGLRDCSIAWAESEPERAEEILEESLDWYEAQGLSREGRKLEKELLRVIEEREKALALPEDEEEEESGDESEAEEAAEKEVDEKEWKAAYLKLLSDTVAEYEKWGYGNKYEPPATLFYLDGDEIPEFAFMGMADGSTYMMYSYADGEVVELGWSEGTEYIPGEGVYSIEQFWGAGGSSETCKWDGKECKSLWYGEWELDFDQPVQGQDGSYGHKYQSNGKVVPEAQYNAEYDRYIDRDRTVSLEYDKSYEEMVRFLSE